MKLFFKTLWLTIKFVWENIKFILKEINETNDIAAKGAMFLLFLIIAFIALVNIKLILMFGGLIFLIYFIFIVLGNFYDAIASMFNK